MKLILGAVGRLKAGPERELATRGVKFVRIQGTPEQRRTKAIEAVDALLRPNT